MKTTKRLLNKELTLTASPFTYLFLLFALVPLFPRVPPLAGTLAVCLGIFYSFLDMKRDNDILFLFLLPGPRKDVVQAKFLFVCVLELTAFVLSAAAVAAGMLRPGELTGLMAPNLFFLGMEVFIFGLFNALFLGGFFKDTKHVGTPFAGFLALGILVMAAGEGLHRIPALQALNEVSGAGVLVQLVILLACGALAVLLTLRSYTRSVASFERLEFSEPPLPQIPQMPQVPPPQNHT